MRHKKYSLYEGTPWFDVVIAWRCSCTFVTAIGVGHKDVSKRATKCWKCGITRTPEMQELKGSDFGPTGGVRV